MERNLKSQIKRSVFLIREVKSKIQNTRSNPTLPKIIKLHMISSQDSDDVQIRRASKRHKSNVISDSESEHDHDSSSGNILLH